MVSLIVAMDKNGGIGKENRLPWHLPSDLKRFKRLTMGHHLVMGRKTYATIGKPLPGRVMIVLSRQKGYLAPGCQVARSLHEAVQFAEVHQESELFIIGGGEVFRQAIDLADKIYLTTVHATVDADISFPQIDPGQWEIVDSETQTRNGQDEYDSEFTLWVRKAK